jgi:hypothetical protein
MSQLNIELALFKRLELFDPTIPKYTLGIKVEEDAKSVFIIASAIPLTSENGSFGDGVIVEERGTFRINCYYPHGFGVSDLLTLTKQVKDHFFPVDGRGLALSESGTVVRIEAPPSLSVVMEPDEFHQAHISQDVDVKYYAHIFPS